MPNKFTLNKKDVILKRLFDLIVSLCAILFLFPVIVISWVIASLDTRMNGFFTQERIGRNGIVFKLLKIRTMQPNKAITTNITTTKDSRITKAGAVMRHLKIDELPQLFNILKGDMSFVGPRPDVSGFADELEGSDRIILNIRPGITGPATLKYRKEEEILAFQENPEVFNRKIIWPDKVRINKEYIENYSFFHDLKIIFMTLIGSSQK
jgi:lipopolysaccharide/colanic/teichoic acid biosynthesis glycosyltransferase